MPPQKMHEKGTPAHATNALVDGDLGRGRRQLLVDDTDAWDR
jgi:hypothetical protein